MKVLTFLFFLTFLLTDSNAQENRIDSLRHLAATAPFPERLKHIKTWNNENPAVFRNEEAPIFREGVEWLIQKPNKDSTDYFDLVVMRVMFGTLLSDTEQLSELFDNASSAIALIDSLGMTTSKWTRMKGHAYFQINVVYALEEKYEEAIPMLENAYNCFERIEDVASMARALNSIGYDYGALKKFDQALEYGTRAKALYQQIESEYGELRAAYYIATYYDDMGRWEEAEQAYRNLLPGLRASNHVSLPGALGDYGALMTRLGRYELARQLLQESLDLAMQRDVKYTVSTVYKYISTLNEETGRYKDALAAHKQYMIYEDSILVQTKEAALKNAQAKFDYAEKQQEIKVLKQEKELEAARSRNRFWQLLAVGFLLTSLLLGWVFVQRQQSKRDRKLREKEQELTALKERLFANITHDLRTPLSLIISPLEEVLPRQADDLSKQQLSLALNNSRRLSQLVNQILDWHSLEEKTLQLTPYRGELVQAVRSCVQLFEGAMSAKGIELEIAIPPQEHFMLLDFDKLEKILSNLLINAIKYTPDHQSIGLRLEVKESTFVLEVRDTGIGIPTDKQGAVFERFYRQATADGFVEVAGSGIGLALTKELTELMGGRIELNSVPQQGSTFRVHLPFELAQPLDEQAVSEETGKPTLLLVEDHLELSTHLTQILSDTYSISHAPDAAIGLRMALRDLPDLIVTDIGLPDRTGLELCQDLKTTLLTDHIPVMILTAYGNEESRKKGLKARADAYMTKPFKTDELRLTLSSLLQNRKRLKLHYQKQDRPSDLPNEEVNPFVAQLMDVVGANYQDSQFNVEAFATCLRISRVQLFKKTKALLQVSPSQILKRFRLEEAGKQLTHSRQTISEIAYTCGFSSPEYFSTVFKDFFHLSPTEYREANRITKS